MKIFGFYVPQDINEPKPHVDAHRTSTGDSFPLLLATYVTTYCTDCCQMSYYATGHLSSFFKAVRLSKTAFNCPEQFDPNYAHLDDATHSGVCAVPCAAH